jgi:hypothetical protein
VGAIFDPVDWPDPLNPRQTTLLSLGFWHGQSCILLDVNDYPGIINIRQQLTTMQCDALSYCQLVVITGDRNSIVNINRMRDIYGVMEANGATLKYNLNQI